MLCVIYKRFFLKFSFFEFFLNSSLVNRRIKMIPLGKNTAFVFVEGNLTADPESKKIGNGKTVTTFSVAVNHSWDENDSEVSFLDIETWDKSAEYCAEYLKKGRSVTVIGQIKQDRWKTAEGANRNRVKIIAWGVRFNRMERAVQREKKAA